jgi:hypothetical protein
MNGFELALTIFFPVLGASGAWIVWHRARDYVADRQRRGRARENERLLATSLDHLMPNNPRLSAEIERLR